MHICLLRVFERIRGKVYILGSCFFSTILSGGSLGMEVYNGPEHGHADSYLIQGSDSNLHLPSLVLEQFEAMYNEGAPEFAVDQGLYYPSATNYGYICTGFESPSDWDDHHRFLGLDGQEIQYSGAQTESLPYVYYTPSYGYAQSPYNPYNPYIPGAMIGVDDPFSGTQQYYSIPSYESSLPSPAYVPMVVQSRPDIISNSMNDSFLESSASANRAGGPGLKSNLSSTSATFSPTPPGLALNQTNSFARGLEGGKASAGTSKYPLTDGSITTGSFYSLASSQGLQDKGTSVTANVSHGKALAIHNQVKISLPAGNGFSKFGSNAQGRTSADKVRPKFQYGGLPTEANGTLDVLIEQNRGPRTNKSTSHLAVKAYTIKAGNSDAHGNIIIYTDEFNKDDFSIHYANAKFFVIKSYSEDDVHKSIKYNVWSSTPNGNKKLSNAYEDAQIIAAGQDRGCPIFLFFSVNASGQFCGVAEMIGPVDFNKDMDFWQQDKWSGSFPVKWHIIKDVPNSNFRHIILENNENKPVTNSRDTQEIGYKKGMEMLKIFKNYTSKTTLLDDFMYYENRQKILQEEKARLLINSYETPFLVPILDPPRKLNSMVNLSSKEDEKIIKPYDLNTSKDVAATFSVPNSLDPNISKSTIMINEAKHEADEKPNDGNSLKIGSLTINPKKAESSRPFEAAAAATVSRAHAETVVTVGSMPVKVNGFAASSSGILTVGTIPLDPRALQLEDASPLTESGSQKG